MTMDDPDPFDALRPRLVRIAYRMLGSVADAEDVVQEAFIRWHDADRAVVLQPEAFLRRVVTRLCLDVLKSARRRRETYVGPWLPEPVVADEDAEAEDVTLPLLMALDTLSPLERAAFLLHDVFGLPFEEVASAIDREPAACRQLASRARAHVRAQRPRFPSPRRGGCRSPRPSSPPRAGATWRRCNRCWPRTWPSMPTAAASVRPPCAPSSGWRR
jgi:RNA polymerase sigma-70 factor (ECF subfamily)